MLASISQSMFAQSLSLQQRHKHDLLGRSLESSTKPHPHATLACNNQLQQKTHGLSNNKSIRDNPGNQSETPDWTLQWRQQIPAHYENTYETNIHNRILVLLNWCSFCLHQILVRIVTLSNRVLFFWTTSKSFRRHAIKEIENDKKNVRYRTD